MWSTCRTVRSSHHKVHGEMPHRDGPVIAKQRRAGVDPAQYRRRGVRLDGIQRVDRGDRLANLRPLPVQAYDRFHRFENTSLRLWRARWPTVAGGNVPRPACCVPGNAPASAAIQPTTVGGMTTRTGSGIGTAADRPPSLRHAAPPIRTRPGQQNRSSRRPAVRVTPHQGLRQPVVVGDRAERSTNSPLCRPATKEISG
jgi:hypothetical protein